MKTRPQTVMRCNVALSPTNQIHLRSKGEGELGKNACFVLHTIALKFVIPAPPYDELEVRGRKYWQARKFAYGLLELAPRGGYRASAARAGSGSRVVLGV